MDIEPNGSYCAPRRLQISQPELGAGFLLSLARTSPIYSQRYVTRLLHRASAIGTLIMNLAETLGNPG